MIQSRWRHLLGEVISSAEDCHRRLCGTNRPEQNAGFDVFLHQTRTRGEGTTEQRATMSADGTPIMCMNRYVSPNRLSPAQPPEMPRPPKERVNGPDFCSILLETLTARSACRSRLFRSLQSAQPSFGIVAGRVLIAEPSTPCDVPIRPESPRIDQTPPPTLGPGRQSAREATLCPDVRPSLFVCACLCLTIVSAPVSVVVSFCYCPKSVVADQTARAFLIAAISAPWLSNAPRCAILCVCRVRVCTVRVCDCVRPSPADPVKRSSSGIRRVLGTKLSAVNGARRLTAARSTIGSDWIRP